MERLSLAAAGASGDRRCSRAGSGALPNLIVIGAMRCGTSALHYYLDLHPEVQMSSPKELNYFLGADDFDPRPFISDDEELRLFGRPPRRNLSRGRRWYERHFDPAAPARGESSVAYTSPWNPRVAELMAATVPDAKLIYCVREPIERIVSHYLHLRAVGAEWRPLERAVAGARSPYLAKSRYAAALDPFLERFPRERILIIRQEDLLDRRAETMRAVFTFLEVSDSFTSPRMERLHNRTVGSMWRFRLAERLRASPAGTLAARLPREARWWVERLAWGGGDAERPRIEGALRAELRRRLDDDIAGLEELTGWDLAKWRVDAPAQARAAAT